MADDFTTISNNITLFAAGLDIAQAQQITQMAFARFAERRIWSWLVGQGCFVPVDMYQTGTVTTVQGNPTVTGSGTAWTGDMVGRQFRVSLYTPIYTIQTVLSSTQIVLDQPYAPVAVSGSTYFIYQAYFSTPTDFREFLTLKDPTNNNYRLNHNITQSILDSADAQRANFNYAVCAAFLDYVGVSQGALSPVQQIVGTGPLPVSSAANGYTYPATATYVVTIGTGGVPGGALTFSWFRISNGVSTASVGPISVTDNDIIDMSDGVGVYFPQTTYIANDIFTFSGTPSSSQMQARYEIWPHVTNSQFNYPFLYFKRVPDFDADHPQLPPMVRPDVILEMALAIAAQMPGTADNPSPYFNLNAAMMHERKAETLIFELEKKDDDTATRDLIYSSMTPFSPNPWFDGSWQQSHGFPYAGMGAW